MGLWVSVTCAAFMVQLPDSDQWRQPLKQVKGPHHVCEDGADHYTGYLPAGDTSFFFWLARARRESPAPLIVWLTGGPGCSSLLATVTENGPCWLDEQGMRVNHHSWSEEADVLWVDQPAGVGYSLQATEGHAKDGDAVARTMLVFLQSFYDTFPALAKSPLYLFGESYAGHYIPPIADLVVQQMPGVLHGVGLGNAVVNQAVQLRTSAKFARDGGRPDGGSLREGFATSEKVREMTQDLPLCEGSIARCRQSQDAQSCIAAAVECAVGEEQAATSMGRNPYDLRKECNRTATHFCYDFRSQWNWFNDPSTRDMLGSRVQSWEVCNFNVQRAFVASGDYFHAYDGAISDLLQRDVRVLVYNGDTDSVVNWVGSKAWISAMQWPGEEEWKRAADVPFLVDGVQRGRQRQALGLTFLQVFNAGHLVPMDVPDVALAMVRDFVSTPVLTSAPAKTSLLFAVGHPWDATTLLVPVLVCVAFLLLVCVRFVLRGRADDRASDYTQIA